MKYKLLATDIDGTLIPFRSNSISKDNREALIWSQEQGIKVALVSGRVRQGIEPFAKELRLDEFGGYIICNNGAEIIDCKTKEVLYRKGLTKDDVTLLYEESIRFGVNTMLMQDDFIIMSGYDEAVQIDHESVHTDFIWPFHMEPYLEKPTYRMNFTKNPKILDQFEQYLVATYAERLEFLRPQTIFLDAMSKGVDKGIALQELAKHTNLSLDQIVACGDGGNDLLMVKYAGLGVATAEAFDSVKEVANDIAPSAENHAIAWVIDKYFK